MTAAESGQRGRAPNPDSAPLRKPEVGDAIIEHYTSTSLDSKRYRKSPLVAIHTRNPQSHRRPHRHIHVHSRVHLGSRSTPAYKSPAQSPPQRTTPVACRRSPLAARPPPPAGAPVVRQQRLTNGPSRSRRREAGSKPKSLPLALSGLGKQPGRSLAHCLGRNQSPVLALRLSVLWHSVFVRSRRRYNPATTE